MHDERSCPCRDEAEPPSRLDDANAERGVLTLVLGDYPEVYTEAELVRGVAFDPERFTERDTVERAIRSLHDIGLLHRCGPLIFPSRAALRFEALEQDGEDR